MQFPELWPCPGMCVLHEVVYSRRGIFVRALGPICFILTWESVAVTPASVFWHVFAVVVVSVL